VVGGADLVPALLQMLAATLEDDETGQETGENDR
jgi:hypothetical protein